MKRDKLLVVPVAIFALLAGWLAWDPHPPMRAAPAAAPPAQLPETLRLPAPLTEAEPPLLPRSVELRGSTRFVRRLEAGLVFLDLLATVEAGGDAQAAMRDPAMAAVLAADGIGDTDATPRRLLEALTHPRRDHRSLHLSRARGDALGRDQVVRVWTLGGDYDPREIESGEDMLGALMAVGGAAPGGFDVLATPRMGRDVFPLLHAPSWAAGVFVSRDGFCVVKSDLRPGFRAEVLKHELVHAYLHGRLGLREPRLVTEGLAEYLRCLARGDAGLRVQPAAMRDNFARLVQMLDRLEAAGVRVAGIDLGRLARLAPWDFYRLGEFGYLMGQAVVACVGGEVVEEAVRARSTAPLVHAAARFRWTEFRRFLDGAATGGASERAVTVTDVFPGRGAAWERSAAHVHRVFRTLGVRGDESAFTTLVGDPADPARLAEVVGLLAAKEPGRLVFFTDLSERMDRAVQLAPWPEGGLAPLRRDAFHATTPREFADALFVALAQPEDGPGVDAHSFPPDSKPLGQPPFTALEPTTTRSVIRLLMAVREGRYVVCLGTDVGEFRVKRLPRVRRPGVLLIVDLSEDGEAAARLAAAFPETKVAIWRPLER